MPLCNLHVHRVRSFFVWPSDKENTCLPFLVQWKLQKYRIPLIKLWSSMTDRHLGKQLALSCTKQSKNVWKLNFIWMSTKFNSKIPECIVQLWVSVFNILFLSFIWILEIETKFISEQMAPCICASPLDITRNFFKLIYSSFSILLCINNSDALHFLAVCLFDLYLKIRLFISCH